MPTETHRIRPEWPDALVYEEDREHTLRFCARSLDEPAVIAVPSAELWQQAMPAWAQAKRAQILARLRDARCILSEEDESHSHLLSLDGAIAVELERVADDRTGPWETMRVLRFPSRELLASASSRGSLNSVRFPAPGSVLIAVTDRSDRGDG
jgi:hypothetical protein